MARINVRIEKRLKEQLEAEARENGVLASVIVRQALQEHVRARTPQASCRDLAERLGLLGAVQALPADLSTRRASAHGRVWA